MNQNNDVSQGKEKLKCSVEFTQSILGGKWKLVILWHLGFDGVHRFNQLQRRLTGVTHKVLSEKLKELENDGLIARKQYNEVPPRVEYTLTEKGKTVIPILDEMHKWGIDNW